MRETQFSLWIFLGARPYPFQGRSSLSKAPKLPAVLHPVAAGQSTAAAEVAAAAAGAGASAGAGRMAATRGTPPNARTKWKKGNGRIVTNYTEDDTNYLELYNTVKKRAASSAPF